MYSKRDMQKISNGFLNDVECITLCGSTKFKKEFEKANTILSLDGKIVYSVAIFGHADNFPLTEEQKENLDIVHKHKILNSDAIFVVDVDGYIGESTKSEIKFAKTFKKKIYYMSEHPLFQMGYDVPQYRIQ